MQRICTTLAENGYSVTLVGRKLPASLPLRKEKYKQVRLRCWFTKGKRFYAEYNMRLLGYLLFKKMDAICAIDLDTILPCLQISKWKNIPRIYDAHELFTGLKEVSTRPAVYRAWTRIEKKAVPQFKWGYTVTESIAREFHRRYKVDYQTIRNVSWLRPLEKVQTSEKFIVYQGAVNEARAFEFLVPAMQWVDHKLVICGDGNFMDTLKKLITEYKLGHRIELKGMLLPDELWDIARNAAVGIAVAENEGINQYMALPNKFFDYLHAGLPQVTMDFPEYKTFNSEYEVALLISEPEPRVIAEALNKLLTDPVLYGRLRDNCMKARQEHNWQNESKKLLQFYQSVFDQ